MSRSAFERDLQSLMEQRLRPLGFKLNRSQEILWRPFDGGMHQVGAAVFSRGGSFEVRLVGSIRLDAVEDLLRRFARVAPGYEKWTPTSTTKQSFLGLPEGWIVDGRDGLPEAADRLIDATATRMLPLLEAYSSIPAFDHAYNVDVGPNFDITMAPRHALVAVAVAWLAGSPHLDRVIRERQLQFETYDPAYQAQLSGLLDYIAGHSRTE